MPAAHLSIRIQEIDCLISSISCHISWVFLVIFLVITSRVLSDPKYFSSYFLSIFVEVPECCLIPSISCHISWAFLVIFPEWCCLIPSISYLVSWVFLVWSQVFLVIFSEIVHTLQLFPCQLGLKSGTKWAHMRMISWGCCLGSETESVLGPSPGPFLKLFSNDRKRNSDILRLLL